MNAKEYVNQIRKLDMLINNKLIEKEQWFTVATSTTVSSEGERVKSSGNQQKMADAVCKLVEIENEIDAMIDSFVDKKNSIIRNIEQLKPDEYDILHKIYVQYMTFDEVAAARKKTYSWATTMHGRALKHLQDIL